MDQGQNYNRGDSATTQDTSSFQCFTPLHSLVPCPSPIPSESPNLSLACSRHLVCSVPHAFPSRPHSLCVKNHPFPCKAPCFLQFTIHRCISLPACYQLGLVHSMWVGKGVGVDIEDPKSVFHQHAFVGHLSGPSEYESALASYLLSLHATTWLAPIGPYREFAYDLGPWGSLGISNAWQAPPCSLFVPAPPLVCR